MILSDDSLRNERCVLTHSGRQLHLLAPDPAQIEIADIAHGLAYQCCFNGQARHFYSIAQHSMLVAQQVAPQHRLAALLHDAAAAYLGAMPQTLRQLMLEFQFIEKKFMAAIGEKFGISSFAVPAIQRAHMVAFATERRDLLRPAGEPVTHAAEPAPIPRRIEALPPDEVKFRFAELLGELAQKALPQAFAVDREARRPHPENPRGAPQRPRGSAGRLRSVS